MLKTQVKGLKEVATGLTKENQILQDKVSSLEETRIDLKHIVMTYIDKVHQDDDVSKSVILKLLQRL